MLSFLTDEERRKKTKSDLERYLMKVVEKARKKELFIGIDPETLTGKEVFKLSREVLELRTVVGTVKSMIESFRMNELRTEIKGLRYEIGELKEIIEKERQSKPAATVYRISYRAKSSKKSL